MQAAKRGNTITLAHGSGGKAMRKLIDEVFVANFDNELLARLDDQARISLQALGACGDRLAFTTDSFVVDPLFFPGGDIGSLAVHGTVNDLAVGGAAPLYLSCGMIVEEGVSIDLLRTVARSMAAAAKDAGVQIVTGDTKVVPRGACDKLFINTSGIGVIPGNLDMHAQRIEPGDVVIVNGNIGDHGAAILQARGDLAIESSIASDSAALNGLVRVMLETCPDIRCMRDATRGGVATVLNEFASARRHRIIVDEGRLPVREEVRGLCEILGLDPLYMANEGKLVAIVPQANSDALLEAMHQHVHGRDAAEVGLVSDIPDGMVVLRTEFGGERVLDMLVGEQMPRIC